jgi:hypothetical protein
MIPHKQIDEAIELCNDAGIKMMRIEEFPYLQYNGDRDAEAIQIRFAEFKSDKPSEFVLFFGNPILPEDMVDEFVSVLKNTQQTVTMLNKFIRGIEKIKRESEILKN